MAIKEVKRSMNLSSFAGDPCLPSGYKYPWVTCSNSSSPRITSLSLSNYDSGGIIPEIISTLTMLEQILLNGNGLEGSIPDLSALTSLETLDLSNNKLSGSIPASLATLKNLKVLHLQNNNLSGKIPGSLLESSTLLFNFSGNPLCQNYNCTFSPFSSITPSKSKSKTGVIVGIIVGVVAIGIIIGLGIFWLCKKRKPRSTLQQSLSFANQELPPFQSPKPNKALNKPIRVLSIKEFTFQEISAATNNFNVELGKGGFGPVYKGTLKDGQLVAVKVASNSSSQGSKEFLNEVDLLSRIHHKNLLGLLGYCTEGRLVLVYEFMSNGSLYDHLHGEHSKASPLSWSTRLRILVDSAQGIDYLHSGCNPRIIHRDIKSSNILLDYHMEAKISDFGISRNSFLNETTAPSTNLMGSMGYIDPEYLTTMRLTEKVDVYSFGVLIFEVLCGRRAVFMDASNEQTHISEWAKSSIDRGVIDEIVDASVRGQYDVSSVWKVVEIALACMESSGSQRPTMSVVCAELKEAERLELGSDWTGAYDKPSTMFEGAGSFTRVQAR